MSISKYSELETLIKEYEEDIQTIRAERLIMRNYAKVFTLSAASMFERYIKDKCNSFLTDPKLPLESNYPEIIDLRKKNKSKPLVDKMFAKLEGYITNNGLEHLSAEQFYNLFGGSSFEARVAHHYNIILDSQINTLNQRIDGLNLLIETDSKYESDYSRNCEVREILESGSFKDAEVAYLSIKLRRNRVAHDYIDGLSDTFVDIKSFYNIAVLYVIALETAIEELTAVENK